MLKEMEISGVSDFASERVYDKRDFHISTQLLRPPFFPPLSGFFFSRFIRL